MWATGQLHLDHQGASPGRCLNQNLGGWGRSHKCLRASGCTHPVCMHLLPIPFCGLEHLQKTFRCSGIWTCIHPTRAHLDLPRFLVPAAPMTSPFACVHLGLHHCPFPPTMQHSAIFLDSLDPTCTAWEPLASTGNEACAFLPCFVLK